jgi:hypothetical protein
MRRDSVLGSGSREEHLAQARGPRSKTGLHQLGDCDARRTRVASSLIHRVDAIHAQALADTPAPQKGFPWRDRIFNSAKL